MSDEVAFILAHAQKNLINLDDSDDEYRDKFTNTNFINCSRID